MSEPCIPVVMRPHDGYADVIDGGYGGYQARCWDCDWVGAEHLRGNERDEPWGSEASRAHKRNAQNEAAEHSRTNQIACCSKCKRAVDQ